MLPDIDSLALFVRAAELRSLTKASEASHIGLAAASRRIALLEHCFKTTLFERSSRGVELTPAGASLLPYAKSLLIQINQMNTEMRDHAHGSKGALRILANTSVMTEALQLAAAGTAGTHISFDMDSLDPSEAPGVGTPVRGGLSYREAHLAMELACDSGCVTSLEVVEVNPVMDERNRTAQLAVELVTSALGKRIL